MRLIDSYTISFAKEHNHNLILGQLVFQLFCIFSLHIMKSKLISVLEQLHIFLFEQTYLMEVLYLVIVIDDPYFYPIG